ncbi:LppU/SCO3897 family protein [Streptomyces sp. NPDC054975]
MSSPEIPITLTPQQAAAGVILTVQLPTGPTHITIPPCRDGDLVPARVGDGTVLLRIRVGGAAQTPRKGGFLGCLVPLVIAGVIAFLVFSSDSDGDDSGTSAAPSPSFSYENPLDSVTTAPTPAPAPTTEDPPDPYTKGTCLNGSLPDSTTAQSVSGVDEVPCSASDAHYRVIQTFPLTSDLSSCESNPKTQYAFSHRYTINGTTINEYVYCLVGLGSYARG